MRRRGLQGFQKNQLHLGETVASSEKLASRARGLAPKKDPPWEMIGAL